MDENGDWSSTMLPSVLALYLDIFGNTVPVMRYFFFKKSDIGFEGSFTWS